LALTSRLWKEVHVSDESTWNPSNVSGYMAMAVSLFSLENVQLEIPVRNCFGKLYIQEKPRNIGLHMRSLIAAWSEHMGWSFYKRAMSTPSHTALAPLSPLCSAGHCHPSAQRDTVAPLLRFLSHVLALAECNTKFDPILLSDRFSRCHS